MSAEQQARDMLERMGIEDAQRFSAGDLVELANLTADAHEVTAARRFLRERDRLLRDLAAAQARDVRARDVLAEIAGAKGFENIGAWARNRARAELSAPCDDSALREMIEAAKAEEREACAKEAERQMEDEPYGHAKFRCANIASEIRARKG